MVKICSCCSVVFTIVFAANLPVFVLSQRNKQDENPQICKKFLKHVDNFDHKNPLMVIMNQEGLFAHWRGLEIVYNLVKKHANRSIILPDFKSQHYTSPTGMDATVLDDSPWIDMCEIFTLPPDITCIRFKIRERAVKLCNCSIINANIWANKPFQYFLPETVAVIPYFDFATGLCVAGTFGPTYYTSTNYEMHIPYIKFQANLQPKYRYRAQLVRDALGMNDDETLTIIQYRRGTTEDMAARCKFSEVNFCNETIPQFITEAKKALIMHGGLSDRGRVYLATNELTWEGLDLLSKASFVLARDLEKQLKDFNFNKLDWFLLELSLMCDIRSKVFTFGASSLQLFLSECTRNKVVHLRGQDWQIKFRNIHDSVFPKGGKNQTSR